MSRLEWMRPMGEVFGPAERLHAAIRRRAPQVAVSIIRDEVDGLSRVRITHRRTGPLIVAWDGMTYRRWTDQGHGDRFTGDPEETADRIAESLGARTSYRVDGRP